ncbi:DUF4124 domain-containing protein [Methylotuvimicrobium alcaliphilum]|uniref:DUF4124 domain-containing protein n=1 Tax=Methylotuvimicrobium alcaliphilum (strain DSM 19304 / NCIMB 14124 / VKM B-2133 / 20Z) TaxID=1091494 RepID=G4T145_META2|nr:DUF4124 domain-containing protein [Methylotuvimicrobium alcaliphilum]CCE24576.1 conserved exported protein of unknown function [Methylotuvimicrobium alcaliphilum 20Z]
MTIIAFLLLLIAISPSVDADVFKCIASSGKITYQGRPCSSDAQQEKVPIEPTDPRQLAEAERRLAIWQMERDKQKAERLEAERMQRQEQHRIEAVEALKRSAEAQRQQALAELRQAEALENQYRMQAYPLYYLPYQSRLPYRDRSRSIDKAPRWPMRDSKSTWMTNSPRR